MSSRSFPLTPRELEEYDALRKTIRERGTARVWVALVGLIAWGALAVATTSLTVLPVATLLPLLVLAVTFEIVFGLHVGVERIGRYIQVYFEGDGEDAGWESRAMRFGRAFPRSGPDPLFAVFFLLATVLNLIPAALNQAVAIEWTVVGVFHLFFALRILQAKQAAGRQRAVDLERFRQLKQQEQAGTHRD